MVALCDLEYGIGSDKRLWSSPKKLLLPTQVIRQCLGLLRQRQDHHNDNDDTSYDSEMSRCALAKSRKSNGSVTSGPGMTR